MTSTGVFIHFCLSRTSIFDRGIEKRVDFLLILDQDRVEILHFLILDQVSHFFIIDFSETDRNAVVKVWTLQFGLGELLKNVPDRSVNDAFALKVVRDTKHGVSFARSSLPIGEYTNVIAIKSALNKW
jgi:hypothetical protein